MRKENGDYRKRLLIVVSCLFVGIISMTLVYAALFTTLDISGTANINSASWRIVIDEADDEMLENIVDSNDDLMIRGIGVVGGSGEIVNYGTTSNDGVKNIGFSLVKPGDVAGVVYKITNRGTLPALFSNIEMLDMTYSSVNNNVADQEWASKNVSSMIEYGRLNDSFGVGDVLCPDDSFHVILAASIDDSTNTIPINTVQVGNLGFKVVFEQTNINSCN